MSPEGLLLLSLAFWLVAVYLHMTDGVDEHDDARNRNPKTWED